MSGTLVTRSVPGWKEMSRQRVITEIRLTVTEMGDFKHHQPLQVHSANHLLFVCVCVCAEVQVPGWGNAPLGAQSSTSGSREKCRDASYEWQEPRSHGGHTWLHATHTHLSCQGGTHTHTHAHAQMLQIILCHRVRVNTHLHGKWIILSHRATIIFLTHSYIFSVTLFGYLDKLQGNLRSGLEA